VPTSVRRRSFDCSTVVCIREDIRENGKVGVGRSCNAVLVESLSPPQVVLAHGENPQFSPRGRFGCLLGVTTTVAWWIVGAYRYIDQL
jgi:hypothetical protein